MNCTISPVTLKPNVRKVNEILVQKIVYLYKNEFSIDVSTYFKGLEKVSIYECLDTNYRFFYPYSIISDEFLYDELKIQHPNYYPSWKWEYEVVLPMLINKKNILEIGCGEGFFLEKIMHKYDITALGIDTNKESITEAKKKGVSAETIDIYTMTYKYQEKFDCIICFQLLEHIADINKFITGVLQLLKSGGVFIVSVPFNKPYLIYTILLICHPITWVFGMINH